MTFSTVLILAGKETGVVWILAVASVFAGIGGALGGGMWTAAYVRLGLHQSVLYGFLSLAFGSLGGLALSFLPEALSYTASMFMPAIALLCYQRAIKTDVGPQPAPEPIYDKEPRWRWASRAAFPPASLFPWTRSSASCTRWAS